MLSHASLLNQRRRRRALPIFVDFRAQCSKATDEWSLPDFINVVIGLHSFSSSEEVAHLWRQLIVQVLDRVTLHGNQIRMNFVLFVLALHIYLFQPVKFIFCPRGDAYDGARCDVWLGAKHGRASQDFCSSHLRGLPPLLQGCCNLYLIRCETRAAPLGDRVLWQEKGSHMRTTYDSGGIFELQIVILGY